MSTGLKVLVVDDHEAARLGICEVLRSAGFEIAGTAGSGKEARAALNHQQFDAVILDVRMPGSDGLVILEAIQTDTHGLPVILLSAYDNPTYIARAAALGAFDYVLKNGNSAKISESLQLAVGGKSPPRGSRLVEVRQKLSQDVDYRNLPPDFPLTSRESQVLVHIALGLSNKEIARSLGISVETVKEHVQNILRKIKAADRTDAAVRAVKMGLA